MLSVCSHSASSHRWFSPVHSPPSSPERDKDEKRPRTTPVTLPYSEPPVDRNTKRLAKKKARDIEHRQEKHSSAHAETYQAESGFDANALRIVRTGWMGMHLGKARELIRAYDDGTIMEIVKYLVKVHFKNPHL